MIRRCDAADFEEMCAVINDAAAAYRGVIAADRWKEPYMPADELRDEIAAGVVFWGFFDTARGEAVDPRARDRLVAVMGLQHVDDVALIRHAYTRTAQQGSGAGSALLEHLRAKTERAMLVGTWTAATWAIRFYERHGFRLVTKRQKERLLRRYWTIPDRQIEESVVLADARWFDQSAGEPE